MTVETNVALAQFTSLHTGGAAERLVTCGTTAELLETLRGVPAGESLWVLGYGCNVLISDAGLPGTTVMLRRGELRREGEELVADAGVWWDDLVQMSLAEELWGLELMSGIPGSVGAAVRGNIAAYGQAAADRLVWAEVFDAASREVRRVGREELEFGYRHSVLQEPDNHWVVLRAAFAPDTRPTCELTYQSALDVAAAQVLDVSTLDGRRAAVLGARAAADSLWDYRVTEHASYNAGSFFRNPLVTPEQAERIIAFDESGRSAELLRRMNAVHGGDARRVSAAHVLLAAGFSRGQSWGSVRLDPHHILKIENAGHATSRQIYEVANQIIDTVKDRLDITLEPEVKFLGQF